MNNEAINILMNTVLKYDFHNFGYLLTAFTHSSFVSETGRKDMQNNERLEFLGDAVLETAISEYIYKNHPGMTEGDMTKLRANVVCEPTLSKAARELKMGQIIRMGRGEENTGGRERGSILADAYEAVAGAIFVDGGFDAARDFIIRTLEHHINDRRENFQTSDFKTYLQELVQKNSKEPLEYTVIAEEGPAHNRTFIVELTHCRKSLSTGRGKSKKEAEQSCARKAIAFFE